MDLLWACSCVPYNITQEIENADMIFTGTVIRKPNTYPIYDSFKITEIFKGNKTDSITIETGIGGGDCGMEFQIGQSYLVYSRNLETSRCRRNALVENTSDIVKLRYLFNPDY